MKNLHTGLDCRPSMNLFEFFFFQFELYINKFVVKGLPLSKIINFGKRHQSMQDQDLAFK